MDQEKESIQKLKWTDYKTNMFEAQRQLLNNDLEYDCVLVSAQGKQVRAHRVILSGCSDFFYRILCDVPFALQPTIYLPDADIRVLESLLTFIYTGETNVASSHLSSFLEFCNLLNIKGFMSNNCFLNGINMGVGDDEPVIANKELQCSNTRSNEEYFLVDEESQLVNLIDSQSDTEDFHIEYLDEIVEDDNDVEAMQKSIEHTVIVKHEHDDDSTTTEYIGMEVQNPCEDDTETNADGMPKAKKIRKRSIYRHLSRNINSEIDEALGEVNKGKTIHQLSVEYNLPRSTLYHRFRNNESLKQNYRLERKSALDQAVRTVIEERLSLKKASDRYNVPKTAIWREVRKFDEYQPITKEVTLERQNAQKEILSGKSLTSISIKYGIPLTTLHRDKKRMSMEGKLPEHWRVKDRTENSEYGQRLEMALQKCREGMSQYQAAKMFNIPKATMWRYAHALLKADQTAKMKEESDPLINT